MNSKIVQRPLYGIGLSLVALWFFSYVDVGAKLASEQVPIGEIVFFRNLFGMVPLFFILPRAGGFAILATPRWPRHFLRAMLGIGAMISLFWSYKLLPLAEASALEMSTSLFLVGFSAIFLREIVTWQRWCAVIVGFVGILIMTQPGSASFDLGSILALLGAVLSALSLMTIRVLAQSESSVVMAFYFTLSGCVVGLLTAPFGWIMPSSQTWLVLGAMGLCGGIGQLLSSHAFKFAPASLLAPFQYLLLVCAAFNGWLIWNDIPGVFVVLGAVIVVAAGIFIARNATSGVRQEEVVPVT